MRRLVPALVLLASLTFAADASAIAPAFWFPSGINAYTWHDGSPGTGTGSGNHGTLNPGANIVFESDNGSTFADHPLIWDTGDLPNDTSAGMSHLYAAPTTPGFYAFHCAIHGTGGTEGSVGSGMAGYIVVPGDAHATPDFSASNATPQAGQQVTLTYTGTPDPDGTITHWLWDLDGNGSFETSTSAGSVTRTYTQAGTVNVALKVIDNGHELSDPVAHALTVSAPPSSGGADTPAGGGGTQPGGGAPGGGGAGGGAGASDTVAPTIAFGALPTRLKRNKLTVPFSSSEPGSASAVMTLGKAKLGSGETTFGAPGPQKLTLALNRAGRKRFKGRRRALRVQLALTVRDAAGNQRVTRKSLSLRP
jgi:hypothetical protein